MANHHGSSKTYRKYVGALCGCVLLTYRALYHIHIHHAEAVDIGLLDHIAETLAKPDYIFRVRLETGIRDIYMTQNIEFNGHAHYTKVICSRTSSCLAQCIITAYYTSKLPVEICIYQAASTFN